MHLNFTYFNNASPRADEHSNCYAAVAGWPGRRNQQPIARFSRDTGPPAIVLDALVKSKARRLSSSGFAFFVRVFHCKTSRTPRDFAQDIAVFGESCHRFAVFFERIKRQVGKGKLLQVVPKRRTVELRHDFGLAF